MSLALPSCEAAPVKPSLEQDRPITRLRLILILTLIVGTCLASGVAGTSCAAQNPFADGADDSVADSSTAQPIEEPAITADMPSTARLLIRSVKQSDPQTPAEFAKAVKIMLDLRQFDFARYYLARLQAATKDDQQRAQLASQMGSDFFLQLHATQQLAPEGKAFARVVLAAGHEAQQSPVQIQQLIGKLNDPDIAIRSRAFRSLRRIGPPAIAALLEAFADSRRQDDFPGVRGAIRNMGPQAIPQLRAAAGASDVSVRVEAIQALAHYRGEGVADVLASAALNASEDSEDQRTRAAAVGAMRRNGYSVPDRSALALRLKKRADALLTGKQTVRGDLAAVVTVWGWDADANRLSPAEVTLATASRIEAARLATELYQLAPFDAGYRETYLVNQLEMAKRKVGTTGQLGEVTPEYFFKQLLPSVGSVSSQELSQLLDVAVEKRAIPAATACCELLAKVGSSQIFYANGHRPAPIVKAILLGDRHLQFAALRAIDQLDPSVAYPGSSYPVQLAVFMANTHQRSAGLVGHHRADLGRLFAGSLSSAGLHGKSANGSRGFFKQATNDPDVSLLLISDTLARPRFDELVRQLRADFRTARTPIGLIVRDNQTRRQIAYLIANDPLTSAFPATVDGDVLASHVRRVASVADADLSAVTDEDRYRHAVAAVEWLAKISSDRDRFGFYELGSRQEQLAGLLQLPGLGKASSDVLANLGTPLAQRELANQASRKSLPPHRRRVAASALNRSIKNGATLLTKDEIKQQYQRYNDAAKTESEDSREILGSVLDAIEQKRDRQR